VLSHAFFDDPLFVWAIPDDDRRQRFALEFFTLYAKAFLRHDQTYTTGGDVVAAALWAPPGAVPISDEDAEELGRLIEELADLTRHASSTSPSCSTPTDDRRDLMTVIAHMRAKPGKEQELYDALEALVEPTTKEPGYVNYDMHQGLQDPALFYFYENWESGEALDAHLNAPHLQQFAARLDDLLEGGSGGLTITRLRRVA
jgi:quinol monooxygenase YgiN